MENGRNISIVTGASRGIGRGIALRLAKEKHNLMIFGRDVSALKKVEKELREFGVETESFSGDVVNEKFVNESIETILKMYGKVDHLINNAGIGIMRKVVDASLEDFRKQMDTNLYGIFNFTKAVLPIMIKRRNGSIINILSLAAKNAFVGGALYSASKHAALGFTKSLMLEVRGYNIRTTAICPGSVDTSFSHGKIQSKNVDKILKPEDIAEAVVAILKMPPRALMSEIDIRPTNPE